MCRHLAYVGPEVPLQDLLLRPPHSLLQQAAEPGELRYARMNADGFGFGWYGEDDVAVVYRRAEPIWQDPNLRDLARNLYADLWVAAVRSASPGFGADVVNAQPFASGDLLFSHNGLIEGFRPSVRRQIQELLDPEVEAEILGTTDSEYLFALIRQLLLDDENLSLEGAVVDAFSSVQSWLNAGKALLNVILTDGERLVASRHSVNDPSPSLHYTLDDEAFPEGAVVIASEPLTDPERWHSIPQGHLLIVVPDEPPELLAL
ncbi:glutamine amidotransferase class-II [Thioalkalivibrio nitratireducens DSM 14787]|uniref:Glutamine amidotransferase class-II n=1 Tax=Thioalkalivibrio nitratireducens (strain DSM 14787 / UNIQEM 213 / ALEN2) TaxID=1255043 RepID=L0DV97_THIND|nr:ergothioneine biosynthesis protein EgtC [Thioalkalivibrio nitratireducens]AGA32948.1 glutamine amidotransferase class-II [Thioalkalivibrio nitratireducens DSM 14787]